LVFGFKQHANARDKISLSLSLSLSLSFCSDPGSKAQRTREIKIVPNFCFSAKKTDFVVSELDSHVLNGCVSMCCGFKIKLSSVFWSV
jgi:hypothetical protein